MIPSVRFIDSEGLHQSLLKLGDDLFMLTTLPRQPFIPR